MSDVPENLPTLRRGTGYAPHLGGCLVQVANWLCDHALWTDRYVHVDPVLGRHGMGVNDLCDVGDRRELALAVVRIAGTAGVLTDAQSAELQAWAKELFLLPGGGAQLCGCECGVTHVAGPRWDGSLSSAEMVERYFLLVEMFEELSGHQPRVVPEEEWAELAMAMSTPPLPGPDSGEITGQNWLNTPVTPVAQEAVAAKVAGWTAAAIKSMTMWTAPHAGTWKVSWSNGQVTSELVSATT